MTYSGFLTVAIAISAIAIVVGALAKVGLARGSRRLAERLSIQAAEQLPRAFQGTVTANKAWVSGDARITYRELTIACDDGTTTSFNVNVMGERDYPVGCRVVKAAGEPRLRITIS